MPTVFNNTLAQHKKPFNATTMLTESKQMIAFILLKNTAQNQHYPATIRHMNIEQKL